MYREDALAQLVHRTLVNLDASRTYRSPFADAWESRATVRRGGRHTLQPEDKGLFFTPELYPVCAHELVLARGSDIVNNLLVQRLLDYLEFTVDLEMLAVIPVATKLGRGRSGLNIPGAMKADAFNIVTDEAWHAQFSNDFACEVSLVTGVLRPVPTAVPAFAHRLDVIRESMPQEIVGLESLLLAIVSETLISGTLSALPRDDRLVEPVRKLIRDHAEDEGRHHTYFRSILRQLWPALTHHERRLIGPHLPAIIYAFLEPDYQQVATRLQQADFVSEDIVQIISETMSLTSVQLSVREGAQPILRYLRELDAFDDKQTLEAFDAAGLV